MLRHRLPLLLVLLLLVACGRAPEAVDTDTDSAAPASTVTTVVEKATVDAPASPAATTAVPSDGASAPETEAYPAPSSGVSDAAAVDAYPAPKWQCPVIRRPKPTRRVPLEAPAMMSFVRRMPSSPPASMHMRQ